MITSDQEETLLLHLAVAIFLLTLLTLYSVLPSHKFRFRSLVTYWRISPVVSSYVEIFLSLSHARSFAYIHTASKEERFFKAHITLKKRKRKSHIRYGYRSAHKARMVRSNLTHPNDATKKHNQVWQKRATRSRTHPFRCQNGVPSP